MLIFRIVSEKSKLGFSALQRAEIAEIRGGQLRLNERQAVSVLFNEPKLLKFEVFHQRAERLHLCFSALQRAEIAEILRRRLRTVQSKKRVSVLFNEPKLLKCGDVSIHAAEPQNVSVLFNEPKLLKLVG